MKSARLMALLLVGAASWQAAAQTSVSFDSSGNGLLKGTYYFRQVAYLIGDDFGNLSRAFALYGNITFDGNGGYTLTATANDSDAGFLQPYSTSGTYVISASGLGSISNPLSSNDSIYGLVSQGSFIGSSTESGFNDIFAATPVGSPQATNASFKGTYWIADLDFPSGDPRVARNSLMQLNPDGAGNLGSISATGYIGTSTNPISQTILGVRYAFSNGAANLTFGGTLTNSNLIAGNHFLYISPDGNFVFGGSPAGWDIFVGVRATPNASPALTLNGMFYQAGIDLDNSQANAATGFSNLTTHYGAFKAGGGVSVGHHRIASGLAASVYDYSFAGSYTVGSDGTYEDAGQKYIVGANGTIRIGFGKGPYPAVNVALQAPNFTGTGVFLDPTAIVNAASSAPFTIGVSRGALITLYGSGLANRTIVDPTFPTTLDNVQVMINNRAAPIYYVSPTQISAVVPYATSESLALIQVINNGTQSNAVTLFMNTTTPGVFTSPAGGVGRAAALHPDYSLITSDSPTQIGETVAVYLTGLGDVNPAVNDGTPGPSNPPSLATSSIAAFVDGIEATVAYAGLAPTLIGLYQVNLTVPTGVSSGNVYLDISGPDSYTSQAVLPIAGGAAATGLSQSIAPDGDVVRPHRPPARFKGSVPATRRNLIPSPVR